MVVGEKSRKKTFQEKHFSRDVDNIFVDEVGICPMYDRPVKEVWVISGFAELHYHIL